MQSNPVWPGPGCDHRSCQVLNAGVAVEIKAFHRGGAVVVTG